MTNNELIKNNKKQGGLIHPGALPNHLDNEVYEEFLSLQPGILEKIEVLVLDLETNPITADVVVAVPMHSKRLRKRGYNQAQLIAKELASLLQLPVSEGIITRIKDTTSQVSLSAEDRRKNVEGAFECTGNELSGKNVLLIDDVCTTGATMNACAITMKESGADSVWGLAFSRDC